MKPPITTSLAPAARPTASRPRFPAPPSARPVDVLSLQGPPNRGVSARSVVTSVSVSVGARAARPSPPEREPTVPEPVLGLPRPTAPASHGPDLARELHVASAAEVLLRVQSWVESGVPRLALEVGGAWGGRIELSRTGPGRVRILWRCRNPHAAGLASRVKTALAASGLTLESVRVDVER